MFKQARFGIHHKAAGAFFGAVAFAHVGGNVAGAVQPGQVEIFKRRHRAAHAIQRQPRHQAAFDGKIEQVDFLENAPHQITVLQVVSGKGCDVGIVQALNIVAALTACQQLGIP